jgi:hypothetical protein
MQCLVGAIILGMASTGAQAVPVPVKNHSFELPVAPDVGGFEAAGTADLWTVSGGMSQVGVFRVMPGGSAGNPTNADPTPSVNQRTQAGYMFTGTGNKLVQGLTTNDATPLPITYQAGQQYTVTLGVGVGSVNPPFGFPAPDADELTIGLYYSSNPADLVAKTTLTPVSGGLTSTLLKDFSATTSLLLPGDPAVGQQIFIQIFTTQNSNPETSFGEFIFDNVRVEAVPEPGSVMGLAGMAAVLLGRRRRSAVTA